MEFHHAPLLFLAAIVAGALNSVAGGGGFIAFPALIFTGVAPITANATNTVALWPGTVASTGAYRRELLSRDTWRFMMPLVLVSLIGAAAGAWLLLHTPQRTFMRTIPWLLLGATVLFTFAGRITDWVRQRIRTHHESGAHRTFAVAGAAALQLTVAIYIGYFGAGAGILMLALFAMLGMENIHTMNAFKTLMASCANGIAVITFAVKGAVLWPQALLMVAGAILGGYGGAWYAQKLEQKTVRWFVTAIGAAMTAYFFYKQP